MSHIRWLAPLAFAALLAPPLVPALSTGALAQECTAPKAAEDLTRAEVDTLYDCIKSELRAGYQAGDNPIAAEYPAWQAASTSPAAPGFHSGRYLMTFINETGYETYVEFAEEGVEMPVGTRIAKESFKLGDDLNVRRGPLFTMEKVAAGTADEFDNWVYGAVQPNGKKMGIKQSFCHDCHVNFEARDNLGYPVEEVRVSN